VDTVFLNSPIYMWVILPMLIFFARICDVSMGTVRVIFITRGMKYLAAVVGFLEILIWLLAIGQIFKNLSNIACYFAYAGGFASGSFLGIYIAERLSLGKVIIRIIAVREHDKLVEFLRAENYGVTTLCAQGTEGPVKIIFSVINRQDLEHVVEIVKKFNPQAFYSIQDVRFASEGIFPEHKFFLRWNYLEMFKPHRKSK
jgi:uncharacterized protein YebE (UPF0316 family)